MKLTRTILIADDDRELVEALTLRMRRLDFEVVATHDAMTALKTVEQRIPDVVCLDVNMPSGDGLSVCEMMAGNERLASIPVIVLTGQQEPETIRRCHNLCAYYVPKTADLWPRVERLLGELFENTPEHDMESNRQPTIVDTIFQLLDAEHDMFVGEKTNDESGDEVAALLPWVLHIDDDAELSATLKIRLEMHGVAVVRAFNGMEGYRTAFTHPASAIILDMEMPNGSGDYVLRRLKENPVTRDIPVVVLTGRKDRHLERIMRGLGASAYLHKPFEFDLIRRELAKHIDILEKPARRFAAADK